MIHLAPVLALYVLAGGAGDEPFVPLPVPTHSVAADIGVTPASLIVCGIADLAPGHVLDVLQGIDDAVYLRQTLAEARLNAEVASKEEGAIRQMLMVEPESPAMLIALNEVSATLSAHASTVEQSLDLLRQTALDGLPEQNVLLLNEWVEFASLPVPPSFRAAVRSQDEWEAVVRALRAEARSQRTGAPVEGEHADLLAAVRAESPVIEAKFRLDQLMDQTLLAFTAFEPN